MKMSADYCIFCCVENSDLVSVHEALSFEGYLCKQNNAAALVKQCFDIKIMKREISYAMCSACLGLLIQAATLKDKLIYNLNFIEDKDVNFIERDYHEKLRQPLKKGSKLKLARVTKRNKLKTNCKLRGINASVKNNLMRVKKEYIITEVPVEISKPSKMILDNMPPVSVKDIVKSELDSLLLNCKDFGLFSWYRSKFKCLVCNEFFADKNNFKVHALQHTAEDLGKVCSRGKFHLGTDLKVDISSMKCRYCGESVTDVDTLRSHLSASHYVQADDLLSRILPFHLTEDEVKCGVCNKGFRNMLTLNKHMNEHSTNYICPHCGKSFVTKERLEAHINNAHMTGTYKCTQCDETFESIYKRGNHVASVHNRRTHLCQHCHQSFHSFTHKIRHLAEAHNEELRRYKCETCPSAYLTSAGLSRHVRNVHLHERNHSCYLCGNSFFDNKRLQDHMIQHTGERAFECQICHKTFSRKRNLVQHIKVHHE